jgi:hypothetical protein
MIMKIPLVAVSRPLHSGVCETRQDAGLPVIHSAISDSGRLRTRGGQQLDTWGALRMARHSKGALYHALYQQRRIARMMFRAPFGARHHP